MAAPINIDELGAEDLVAACDLLPPEHIVAFLGNATGVALDLLPFGEGSKPVTIKPWDTFCASTSTGADGKRAFAAGCLLDAAEQGIGDSGPWFVVNVLAPSGTEASSAAWKAIRKRLGAERRKTVQVLGSTVDEMEQAAEDADREAWHLASDASARAHDAIRRDALDLLDRTRRQGPSASAAVLARIDQARQARAEIDAEREDRNDSAAAVMAAAPGDEPDASDHGRLDAQDLLDMLGLGSAQDLPE